jgi:menaquinone-dependent protoporphyrinogen oxidase
MSDRVLIAYGSKHGSTAETAEALAKMIRVRGAEADVAEAASVESLEGYGRVVVGGSIYAGRWHPHVKDFVRRFEDDLRVRPVAFFAMGPKTSEPDDLAEARKQLDLTLRKLPDVGADPIAIFGGVIDPAKLRFPFNRLAAIDARDWEAISSFAGRVVALRTDARIPVG